MQREHKRGDFLKASGLGLAAGVAPYSITAAKTSLARGAWHVSWQVISASGALLALANPLNRVSATLDRPGTVTPTPTAGGRPSP